MSTKTVTVDVDVDVYLDEWDDDELINEMKDRGYECLQSDGGIDFDQEDWQFMLNTLDNIPENWYTRRLRDKILRVRYG